MTEKAKDRTKEILKVVVIVLGLMGGGFIIDDRIEVRAVQTENRITDSAERLRNVETTLARIEERLKALDERLHICKCRE